MRNIVNRPKLSMLGSSSRNQVIKGRIKMYAMQTRQVSKKGPSQVVESDHLSILGTQIGVEAMTASYEQNRSGKQKFSQIVATWRRRLFTKMDIYRLHALSSIVFMTYTSFEIFRVMFTILVDRELPYAEYSWIPPVLLLINYVKDVSAIRLAINHRQGLIKNVFTVSSVVSFVTTLAMYYYDPYFPRALDVPFRAVSLLVFPVLLFSGVYFCKESFRIVELRDDKDTRDVSKESKLLGWLFYVVPLIVPIFFLVNTSFMIAFGGWDLREYFFYIFPHQTQATYSLAVMGVATGSIGPFAPTLRDRKLINRTVEMGLISIPFICLMIAFIATCYIYEDGWNILSAFINPAVTVSLVKEAVGFSS